MDWQVAYSTRHAIYLDRQVSWQLQCECVSQSTPRIANPPEHLVYQTWKTQDIQTPRWLTKRRTNGHEVADPRRIQGNLNTIVTTTLDRLRKATQVSISHVAPQETQRENSPEKPAADM